MIDLVDFLLRVGVVLIITGAVYGGIRADLRGRAERLSDVKREADRAHVRIDDHIDFHVASKGV